MSELQDALKDVDDLADGSEPDTFRVIVDAARRYADLLDSRIEIRYCVWHQSRMPYGAKHCQMADDLACAPGDYFLIPWMDRSTAIDPPEET